MPTYTRVSYLLIFLCYSFSYTCHLDISLEILTFNFDVVREDI